MVRLLLALAGVILLAVTGLGLVWLFGQLLVGLGAFVVGAAGVLGRLLWYLIFSGMLGALMYFVTSAWRPATRRQASQPEWAGVPAASRLEKAQLTQTSPSNAKAQEDAGERTPA